MPDKQSSDIVFELQGVVCHYDGFALGPVDLVVRKGEWHAIIGESGVGKTSVLRTINLMFEPSAGRIMWRDRMVWGHPHAKGTNKAELTQLRKSIAMILQQGGLWPHRTIIENVMEGPRFVLKMGKADARDVAQDILNALGICDQSHKLPREVSGGQARRAAIARALAIQPDVLLCDEITTGLDPIAAGEVLDHLASQQEERSLTVVMVTHHLGFVRRRATHVTLIAGGRFEKSCPCDQFFEEASSGGNGSLVKVARDLNI